MSSVVSCLATLDMGWQSPLTNRKFHWDHKVLWDWGETDFPIGYMEIVICVALGFIVAMVCMGHWGFVFV